MDKVDKKYGIGASAFMRELIQEVIREMKGYSPQLVSKDNPKGETDGLTTDTMNKILMQIIKDLDENSPGLWANIRAKRARGEKPAHKNSNAHKDAVKAGKEINKNS